MRERAQSVARELARGGLAPEPGGEQMRATRLAVVQGWEAMAGKPGTGKDNSTLATHCAGS